MLMWPRWSVGHGLLGSEGGRPWAQFRKRVEERACNERYATEMLGHTCEDVRLWVSMQIERTWISLTPLRALSLLLPI